MGSGALAMGRAARLASPSSRRSGRGHRGERRALSPRMKAMAPVADRAGHPHAGGRGEGRRAVGCRTARMLPKRQPPSLGCEPRGGRRGGVEGAVGPGGVSRAPRTPPAPCAWAAGCAGPRARRPRWPRRAAGSPERLQEDAAAPRRISSPIRPPAVAAGDDGVLARRAGGVAGISPRESRQSAAPATVHGGLAVVHFAVGHGRWRGREIERENVIRC